VILGEKTMRCNLLIIPLALFLAVPCPGQESRVAILKGHSAPVINLAFSPDGKTLVSSASDHKFNPQTRRVEVKRVEVKVWDVPSQKERFTLKNQRATILALAFAPDGKTFACGGGDLSAKAIVRKDESGKEEVVLNGELKFWNPATGEEQASLEGFTRNVHALAFAPDGKTLVSSSKSVQFWDLQSLKPRAELPGLATIGPVLFSSDGKVLATASHDRLTLWDPASAKQTKAIKIPTGQFLAAWALAADAHTIATTTRPIKDPLQDKDIKIWDVSTGEVRHTLTGHDARIFSLDYSPDNKLLLSASGDGTAKLWDVATGKLCGSVLDGETGEVDRAVFSPDGKMFATGSYDGRIMLWDTAKVLASAR
jgi:WD40 repeat protein